MIPSSMDESTITEMLVDKARLNFNLLSKKLANGVNNKAKRNAKNKGAKMGCPTLIRNPKIKILIKTNAVRSTKGSFISFIYSSSFSKFKIRKI